MIINQKLKFQETLFWDYKYKDLKNIYNPNRDSYFHKHFKEPIKNLPHPAKVLEIACGVRTDGIELARFGIQLTELDISPIAVAKAKELFDSQNLVGSFNGLIVLGVEPNAWPYYTLYLLFKPIKILIRYLNPRPYNSSADDQCWGFTKHKFKKLFKLADIKILEIKRVKYLQEFYEQYIRLINRLLRKNSEANKNIMNRLCLLDQWLAKIPILNLFNWHWNVIGKKV